MTYITGHDRSQMLLLPEAIDDYVDADNPVRFIDSFVDGLDLAAAGFARVVPEATGPRAMLLDAAGGASADHDIIPTFHRHRSCSGAHPQALL